MNAMTLQRSICFAIAATFAVSFTGIAAAQQRTTAAEPETTLPVGDAVELLSRATGLTEHEIQVQLGKQHYWADNILAYDFADGRFRKMVGYQVYYDLKTQDALSAEDVQHLTDMALKRRAADVAIVR